MLKFFTFLVLVGLSFGISMGNSFSGIDIKNLYHCVLEVPSYFWHTTQDDIGNTYLGLYTQWDGTELCAYIFKIDTEGKLSIVYYDRARHIHTVAFNPVTKKIYASQGDDVPRLPQTKGQSKFLVSSDYGVTWQVLQNYPRANYIPILFDSKWCVIVGEDSAQYSPSSRLMRTCDDRRFQTLVTLSWSEQANRWSWYQSWSEMYVWTVIDQAGYVPTVWKSSDDGNTWAKVAQYAGETQAWDGFHSMGLNRWWVLLYYFGNARKETSAFTSLTQRWNTKSSK
jgi:hypothetical protein